MAEWELSKENIQPLKHGRKMATLNNILQGRDEDVQKLLHEERNKYETELRSYDGPDPLDPWYRYISWVEQSYPKGGKEGNIHVLIQKCIEAFKDDKNYSLDPRYLEVWLKYASMAIKPIDVYNFMYTNGICTRQAGLFDAWSWHLETSNNFKSAEAVFLKGLDAVTDKEAKQGLAARKAQFEARIAKRLNGEEIPAEEIEEQEERSALGRLKTSGKHGKVGSVRVGSVKLGGPGVLQSQPLKLPLKPNNTGGFKVFSDENAPSGIKRSDKASNSIPVKEDYKENHLAAGKWSSGTKGPKAINVPLNKISQHAKPAFAVHEDNVEAGSTVAPHMLNPGESNILSARKLDKEDPTLHCPIALFEPPDPTKRSMYCKDKVYQGATEFSFEELRAVRWRKKEKADLEALAIEKKKQELVEMERRLIERQEEMARQMEEFKKMALINNKPEILVTTPSLSDSRSLQSSSNPDTSTVSTDTKSDSSYKRGYINDSGHLAGSQNQSSITPSPHGHKKPMFHPSPTVNTKEALALMQQLWSTSSEMDPNTSETALAPKAQFQIFSDEESALVSAPTPKFEIFVDKTEEVPKLATRIPFQIFSDDKENAVVEPPKKWKAVDVPVFNFDKETENDENMPPPGFVQPFGQPRAKTGILTPAENVDWMPLDEQEKLLDKDEQMQEESLGIAKPMIGNATMVLPNEDDFYKMSKISSTPFTGRSFVPMEDENTCDVQLFLNNKKDDDSFFMPPPPPTGFVAEGPPLTPLSPIVETSREHYKSSSSSSGADTTHGTTRGDHSKSHWGNTGVSTHFKTADNTAGLGFSLGARTPGNGLLSNCASGYVGDKSSMSSSTTFKQDRAHFDFRQRMGSGNLQDDDQTGMFSDMLAEFKQVIQKPSADENHIETSVHPSFLETKERSEFVEHSLLHQSSNVVFDGKHTLSTLSMTGLGVQEQSIAHLHVNSTCDVLHLTSGPGLDKTEVNHDLPIPGLDLTSAPGLDMTGSPFLSRTNLKVSHDFTEPNLDMPAAPVLETTGALSINRTGLRPRLDMTEDGVSLNLTEPMLEEVDERLQINLDFTNYNPFSMEWQDKLLSCLPVPVHQRHGYIKMEDKLPNVRIKSCLTLGEDKFIVTALKGEGGFAKVYSARTQPNDLNCTIAGIDAVLKVQKPANEWEWYICTEVSQRIQASNFSNLAAAFMTIPRNYSFSNGGIFVSYHQKMGNLLDLINLVKVENTRSMETVSIYFTIEILYIVEALHSLGIIHADLKPDNFLLKDVPCIRDGADSAQRLFDFSSTSVQLIDFGRAIDLNILPKGIVFKEEVKTDGIRCIEMREGREWREHIDYYGIAATAYCLLFGTYMEVVKTKDVWEVKGSFKRFFKATDLWKQFFHEFLNIKNTSKESLPVLREWRIKFMEIFYRENMKEALQEVKARVQSRS